MNRSIEFNERIATGRVLTGNDCEYIKLASVTANDGCTDGIDEDVSHYEIHVDNFRIQVCDQAGFRSEETIPHPEW